MQRTSRIRERVPQWDVVEAGKTASVINPLPPTDRRGRVNIIHEAARDYNGIMHANRFQSSV